MQPSRPLPQRIAFEHFEIDLSSGQLLKNGRRIRLQPQPFRLLEMMVKRPGEVITREEVCQALWGAETFVDFDHGLGTAVNKIREALSDSAENPRYVETLPRRGYRFIGTIKPHAPQLSPMQKAISDIPGGPQGEAVGKHVKSAAAQPRDGRTEWARIGARIGIGVVCVLTAIAAYRMAPRVEQAAMSVIPFTDYPGLEYCPGFSPDGSRISFAWDGGSGEGMRNSNLYVKVIDSENLLRLTQQPSHFVCGTWSPDGTQIAFRRVADGDNGIYVVPALGGPERKLLSTQAARDISWSADGKWLAYSDSPRAHDHPRIYFLSLETLEKRQIPHEQACLEEFQPAFVHSGERLAYACLLKTTDNEIGIYTTSLAGDAPKLITKFMTGWDIPAGLAWTADDKRLIVSRPRLGDDYELNEITVQDGSVRRLSFSPWAMSPAVPSKGGRLAYMNYSSHVDIWRRDLLRPEAAAAKMIASTIDQTNPNYSPDGKHIAFCSKRGGEWEIWMTDADGKHFVRLSDGKTSRAGSPHWSPDSQKIAFDSRQSGHTEVDIVDITERLPRKLVTNLAEMSVPSWSRDGKWIYFQSTSDTKIFRCRASGGNAEALTAESGSFASESFDGKSVNFYSAASGGKLRTVSLNKVGVSREIEGMPEVNDQSQYTLVAGGIYYVPADAPKSVWYYDSSTKQARKLFDAEQYHNNTLSVSPDGRWMLYTQIDRQNSDIMLVENFR
jgi:Tol biopolymer transport system component/DNA-binding winged helix-turn-helix (wHTH) protein